MARGDNPNSRKNLKTPKAIENQFKQGEKKPKEQIKKREQTKALKRTFKEEMLLALETTVAKDKDGNDIQARKAIVMQAVKDAINGDWKAREFCRDTAGEKPVDKIEMTEIDGTILNEIEKMVREM